MMLPKRFYMLFVTLVLAVVLLLLPAGQCGPVPKVNEVRKSGKTKKQKKKLYNYNRIHGVYLDSLQQQLQ